MEVLGWFRDHWFSLLQTASIVVGLFATAHSIRSDARERKIANLFAITAAHRELWGQFYEGKSLDRIFEKDLDLKNDPPTLAEQRFVHELILHLRASFKAREIRAQFDDDGLSADIHQFFARSIPRFVWNRSKAFQDRDFVAFVDFCIHGKTGAEVVTP